MIKTIWNEYKNDFLKIQLTFSRLKLITKYSIRIFQSFPNSLPNHLKTEFEENYKSINDPLISIMRISLEADMEPNEKDKRKIQQLQKVFRRNQKSSDSAEFFYKFNLDRNKIRKEDESFSQIIRTQELILLCSYIDAFLSDSIKYVYKVHPEMLSCEKTVTWKEILAAENKNDLIETIAEKQVIDCSFGSITKKLDYIRTKLNIEVNISNIQEIQLRLIEQIRNLFVHKNGKVDQEFIKKKPKEIGINFINGETLCLNEDFLNLTENIINYTSQAVFHSISIKIFKRSEKELRPPLLSLSRVRSRPE